MCFVVNRREDREPSKHSRVCSCHFRNGQKGNGPEMFDRNKDKLFTEQRGPPPKRQKNTESKVQTLSQIIEIARKNEQPSVADTEQNVQTTQEIILKAELDFANRELKELNQTEERGIRTLCLRLREMSYEWRQVFQPKKSLILL